MPPDHKYILTSDGIFPDNFLHTLGPEIEKFDAPYIVVRHTTANQYNLIALSRIVDRLIVNVRDPRQALLSFVHHRNRSKLNIAGVAEFVIWPNSNKNYYSVSFQEQIDSEIESGFLPLAIKWIEGWIDASENQSFYPRILFTKHEDLATNPQAFFESILDFYDLDKSKFKFPDPPEFKEGTHNRKGSIDEWREVFTEEQIEKASSMIPKRILERFGWSEK